MSTSGIKSWDQLSFGGNKQSQDQARTDFLRLEDGSNVVRVVTDPVPFLFHRYKPLETDKGFGDKVKSCFPADTKVFEAGVDPLFDRKVALAKDDAEKKKARPSQHWYIGVIEKKTMTFKILEASYALIKAIHTISQDSDYGDPKGYYVDIKVDRNGGATGYYTVIPKPPTPHSVEELSLIENINHDTLTKLAAPITADQQKERVSRVNEKYAKLRGETAPVQKVSAPVVATASSSDDDLDFEPVS